MPSAARTNVLRLSLGALVMSGVVATAEAQVSINEFLFRDTESRLEFIELFNRSAMPVALNELAISDSRRAPVAVTHRPMVLEPGSYAVLVRDSIVFDARFDVDRIEVASWPVLNNGGDGVLLWMRGEPIDSVFFDETWGSNGRSVERIDPDAPPYAGNWMESNDPSGGTPGVQNSVFAPDRQPPRVVDAEEWTDGSVILYMSEPVDSNALTFANIRFRDGARPLSSQVTGGGTRIILEPWPAADLSVVTVEGLRDLSGNSAGTLSIQIARQPRRGEIILNELLFEPVADAFDDLPDQPEFVEVRSLAAHPIALRGVHLTGRLDETGVRDTLRSADLPMRVHAGRYALYYAAGTGSDRIQEAFSQLPPDSVVIAAPVRASSLLLDNTGDVVRLQSASGDLLDEVEYERSWHAPERTTTRGISLERISATSRSNERSNWTSSVSPDGSTPGRRNSVAPENVATNGSHLSVTPSPFSPDADGFEDFTSINVQTGRPSSSIVVWIFDEAGRLARRLTDASPVGPKVSLIWDGRDDNGHLLGTGSFIVFVEAVDTSIGDVRRFKRPVVLVRGL